MPKTKRPVSFQRFAHHPIRSNARFRYLEQQFNMVNSIIASVKHGSPYKITQITYNGICRGYKENHKLFDNVNERKRMYKIMIDTLHEAIDYAFERGNSDVMITSSMTKGWAPGALVTERKTFREWVDTDLAAIVKKWEAETS